MSTTADLKSEHFFSSFMAVVEGMCNSRPNEVDNGQQMESLLSSWNMKKICIPGDGNCLFASIAFSLVHRVERGDRATIECLHKLGIPDTHLRDVNHIQRMLRIQMVKEWTANPQLYQGFITDDITSLSQEYLQDGHFTGCVGDLMVLTLANLLGMPISIFTSVTNMPLLCVMPTTETSVITQPIFLAYIQTGPGHFDVALPITDGVSPSVTHSKKQTKCTCGRNPKSDGKACSSLRCACVRGSKECTGCCVCKGCSNKYGVHPLPSTTTRRQSYDAQQHPLTGRTL